MAVKNLTKTYLYAGIILTFLVLMIVMGLSGWYSYVIPNLLKLGTYSPSAIIAFAFLAGLASFFSPCVFALLPAYMSYFFTLTKNEIGEAQNPRRLDSSLIIGFFGAFGMFVFILPFGTLVSVLGWGGVPYLRLFSPLMGILFIIFGAMLLMDYTLNVGQFHGLLMKLLSEDRAFHRRVFLYGIAYAAGSAGCTAPILFALIIFSLMVGGLFLTIFSLMVYWAAMGMLMVLVTILAAKSKEEVLQKLRVPTAILKEASGIVLILTGILLITIYIILNLL